MLIKVILKKFGSAGASVDVSENKEPELKHLCENSTGL